MRNLAVPLAAVVFAQICGAASAGAQVPVPITPEQRAGALDPRLACTTVVTATKIEGDPNAALVRIIDPPTPPAGQITAYGAETAWAGTIGDTARSVNGEGAVERSLVVRASGPIEGIAYGPPGTACAAQAGVTAAVAQRSVASTQRPVVVLSDPRPVPPATCARPYAAPTTLHADPPYIPAIAMQQNIQGIVRVRLSLDANGVSRSARIVASPSPILNNSALSAATHSRFSPAVFRCVAVPTAYDFIVTYANVG